MISQQHTHRQTTDTLKNFFELEKVMVVAGTRLSEKVVAVVVVVVEDRYRPVRKVNVSVSVCVYLHHHHHHHHHHRYHHHFADITSPSLCWRSSDSRQTTQSCCCCCYFIFAFVSFSLSYFLKHAAPQDKANKTTIAVLFRLNWTVCAKKERENCYPSGPVYHQHFLRVSTSSSSLPTLSLSLSHSRCLLLSLHLQCIIFTHLLSLFLIGEKIETSCTLAFLFYCFFF